MFYLKNIAFGAIWFCWFERFTVLWLRYSSVNCSQLKVLWIDKHAKHYDGMADSIYQTPTSWRQLSCWRDAHYYLKFCFGINYLQDAHLSGWNYFFMDIVEGTVLAKVVVNWSFWLGFSDLIMARLIAGNLLV